MNITIVTCMKNEGPFIIEWVAYNRMIWVTDFLIYTNDCTDGTDELLDALAAHGIVTRLPNPARDGERYQMAALKASANHDLVLGADWTYVCDIDEFMVVHVGGGTIPDLVTVCGNPQAISVTMRMMANGGVDAYQDLPVTAQFTRTHDPALWGDQKAIEVKSLIRSDFPLRNFGAHRPFVQASFDFEGGMLDWTDGSGRQVPDAFVKVENKRRRHRFPARGASRFASLNHYTLRSLDSYLVKSHRGDVNREHRHFQTEYWRARNDDRVEETRITQRLPQLRAEMAHLLNLSGVSNAHQACVLNHKKMAERLKADPDYQALRNDLIAISPALQRA